MNIDNSEVKKQRERRFFLFLPMAILPFIIFLCWKMGAGQQATTGERPQKSGLLTELPGAELLAGDSQRGKLELYAQAKRDSMRLQELIRIDPYHTSLLDSTVDYGDAFIPQMQGPDFIKAPAGQAELATSKIYEKLGFLQQQMDLPEQASMSMAHGADPSRSGVAGHDQESVQGNPLVEHLPSQDLGAPSTEDSEISLLNGMLDKVLGAPVRL